MGCLILGAIAGFIVYSLLSSRRGRQGKPLPEEEARAVLGVSAQAGREEIHEAWKRLMQKNHPDQGGSDYLAAQINAAKERLVEK